MTTREAIRRTRAIYIRHTVAGLVVAIQVVQMIAGVAAARADAAAYLGKKEISVSQANLTFRHVHRWDSPKLQQLISDTAHHDRFLTDANDFAFVELLDGDTRVFRAASPALTHLWISPDAQYFVGLSEIKRANPYQLVVWRRNGSVLHREHIATVVVMLSTDQRREFAERFPDAERFLANYYFSYEGGTYLDCFRLGINKPIGYAAFEYLLEHYVPHPYSSDFNESVSNWIGWFHESDPVVGIFESDAGLRIVLRSPTGEQFRIAIKR